jgi:diguanylate cyclase (GGDEF)-like protein
MVDIDHFKTINDTWGHSAGDTVLQEVSHLIRNALRDVDIIGRMGGEEFAVMLVETDVDQARQLAQRLCTTVADTMIVLKEGVPPLQITISVGLTGLKGRDIDFDSLLNEADMVLYSAKQSGRNKVVISA